MRINSILVLMAVFILIPISSMASEVNAGEDVNPADNEAPFTIAERTSPSVDGDVWSLSIVMNDEEAANDTEFELITQVCTNDGVCDPPVKMDAEKEGNTYSISVTPPSDHTYVNWRVKAIYNDGNTTNFPQGDWYKTWSSCYYQQDSGWGGEDYQDGECSTGEDVGLPGFGAVIASTGIAFAAITRRD
jgi:hypothetical protein